MVGNVDSAITGPGGANCHRLVDAFIFSIVCKFSSAPATGTLVVLSAGIGVDMEGEDVWHNSVT